MLRRLTLLAVTLALAVPGVATADVIETTQTWYLRNAGSGCGSNAAFHLATQAGGDEPNCGYVGGFAFGETPLFDSTKVFPTSDGVPVVLNADAEDAAGVIRIRHSNGLAGVGQVVINIELTGTTEDNPFTPVTLGSTSVDGLVTTTGGQDFPFALDLDDAHDGQRFTQLSLSVEVRGLHVLTGYVSASKGESQVTVPILIEEPEL